MNWLRRIWRFLGGKRNPAVSIEWKEAWSQFLDEEVVFYQALSDEDKATFQKRILLFWQTTSIESGSFEVSEKDCLLVAASAIIPVWAFPNWHYFNLSCVYLFPGAFNEQFECGKPDSFITGMVGTGPLAGKMALSAPDLHLGFKNHRDKQNVGIHEFVHLIDMMDGECDGYPERLKEHAFSIPWFELVARKTHAIRQRKSNIREYGATNRVEFFAVASEYFFERPRMLEKKHPELFEALTDIYQQDVSAIVADLKPAKRKPCPCGSGKRYKNCCMPKA